MNPSEETNDVRERMQEVGRAVAVILPPNTGFVILAFDFGPNSKLEYVANTHDREAICKLMIEWIKKTEGGKFAKFLA